jgi:hypothetical protein
LFFKFSSTVTLILSSSINNENILKKIFHY